MPRDAKLNNLSPLEKLRRARAAWSTKDREARQKRTALETAWCDPKADKAALANEAALADEAAALAKRDYEAATERSRQAARAAEQSGIAPGEPDEAAAEQKRESGRQAFERPVWSYGNALSWVTFCDPELLCEFPDRSAFNAARRYQQMDGDQADKLLLVALQRGEITAVRNGIRLRQEDWFNKHISDLTDDLRFERDEVLKRWPVQDDATGATPPAGGDARQIPTSGVPVTGPGGPERPPGVSDSCWATCEAAFAINPTLGTKWGDVSATAQSLVELAEYRKREVEGVRRDLQRVLRAIRKNNPAQLGKIEQRG